MKCSCQSLQLSLCNFGSEKLLGQSDRFARRRFCTQSILWTIVEKGAGVALSHNGGRLFARLVRKLSSQSDYYFGTQNFDILQKRKSPEYILLRKHLEEVKLVVFVQKLNICQNVLNLCTIIVIASNRSNNPFVYSKSLHLYIHRIEEFNNIDGCQPTPFSVTRLGDFLHFGQLFKASGNNYFAQIAYIFRQFV